MACGAVDERRIEGRHRAALTPERGGTRAFAFFAKGVGKQAGFSRDGAGNPGADGIENVANGLFHHGVGNGLNGRFDDEARQRFAFKLSLGHDGKLKKSERNISAENRPAAEWANGPNKEERRA